ncbi:hypothetical protein N9J72_02340 [Candidatus Gracilibacteria bacterium]|nr:hypothetical protein [Candidatus Gracilibacteria bacterium]
MTNTFRKISKIIFLNGKSYLLFVFMATFLSLFSYILSSNIILSVEDYLTSQVKPLLGGDIVLSSSESSFVTDDFLEKYSDQFVIAQTLETSTTIFDANQNPKLIDLVYHDDNYPVYDQFAYDTIDASGSLIVAQEVYDLFGSDIEIFGEMYKVQGIITEKPLEGVSFFSNALEVYLPLEEFKPELNEDNSRLSHRAYFEFRGAYDEGVVEQIKSDPSLSSLRIRSLDDRNETIGGVTDRLTLFIHFFNLIVFLLTFFIVILSLETFYKKLKNTIGLLSILGLKKKQIFLYTVCILGIIFFVSLLGAFMLNSVFINMLHAQYDFFRVYDISFFKGIAITGILLFVGVYSPFYKVYTSDISHLLSDSSAFSNFGKREYFIYIFLIFLGFFGVGYISSLGFLSSVIYSSAFVLVVVVLYMGVTYLLQKSFHILKKYFSAKKNFYLFDALRSTIKPGNVSFLIVFSSIVSFASIFVFYIFAGSFLGYIDRLTENSNDAFIINISKNDIEATREFFTEDEIYEIVSMRISEINSQTLQEYFDVERVPRSYSREFFSTTRDLNDTIISGDSITSGGVSVDEDFAQEMGFKIGDTLDFTVAGLEKELQVQALRSSEREGANPFFYFALFQDDFTDFPKNYFVSYKSENKASDIQFQYSEAITGSPSFINTREIIEVVLDVADKILIIIYFCVAYIAVFSFLTFIVSVSFLRTFKSQKLQLMHILGGERKKLLFGVFFEYCYLIIFGLTLSLIFSTILLFGLQYFIDVFQISFSAFVEGIIILGILFFIMTLYLRFSKRSL